MASEGAEDEVPRACLGTGETPESACYAWLGFKAAATWETWSEFPALMPGTLEAAVQTGMLPAEQPGMTTVRQGTHPGDIGATLRKLLEVNSGTT